MDILYEDVLESWECAAFEPKAAFEVSERLLSNCGPIRDPNLFGITKAFRIEKQEATQSM